MRLRSFFVPAMIAANKAVKAPIHAIRCGRPSTAAIKRPRAHEQEHARRHHRRGVHQRRGRRRAFHRVGQPEVERELRGLGARGPHEAHADERPDRRRRRLAILRYSRWKCVILN